MYKQESDIDSMSKDLKKNRLNVGKDVMSLTHLYLWGEGINISFSKCMSASVLYATQPKVGPYVYPLIKFFFHISRYLFI